MNAPRVPPAWRREWQARNGRWLASRPIERGDLQRERVFIDGLSAESRYQRFMFPLRGATGTLAREFVDVDYFERMALVAHERDDVAQRFVAVARYAPTTPATPATREFAIAVADAWHRQGVGSELLRQLCEYAAEHGVSQLAGTVLASNVAMLELARRLGFERHRDQHAAGQVLVKLDLARTQGRRPLP